MPVWTVSISKESSWLTESSYLASFFLSDIADDMVRLLKKKQLAKKVIQAVGWRSLLALFSVQNEFSWEKNVHIKVGRIPDEEKKEYGFYVVPMPPDYAIWVREKKN